MKLKNATKDVDNRALTTYLSMTSSMSTSQSSENDEPLGMTVSDCRQVFLNAVTNDLADRLRQLLEPMKIGSTVYTINIKDRFPVMSIQLHSWNGRAIQECFDLEKIELLCPSTFIKEVSKGSLRITIKLDMKKERIINDMSDLSFIDLLIFLRDRETDLISALQFPARKIS